MWKAIFDRMSCHHMVPVWSNYDTNKVYKTVNKRCKWSFSLLEGFCTALEQQTLSLYFHTMTLEHSTKQQ